MVRFPISELDIAKIAASGQCYRMERSEKGYFSIIYRTHQLSAYQPMDADEVAFDCSQDEFDEIWAHYFDMDHDYSRFLKRIDPDDTYLMEAARYGQGIRILRQDLWETTCTFIISQNNKAKRVETTVANLCNELGEKCEHNGVTFHAFPVPNRLMDPSLVRLYGVGYRTSSLSAVARDVANGSFDLDALAAAEDYTTAHRTLIVIPGIGPKVAASIELFGLHWLDACPVDTLLRRAISEHYEGEFDWKRYEGFRGVIQQYITAYERWLARSEELRRVPSARPH